jgi:hypothetical protein
MDPWGKYTFQFYLNGIQIKGHKMFPLESQETQVRFQGLPRLEALATHQILWAIY